jgi:hypothetical protein
VAAAAGTALVLAAGLVVYFLATRDREPALTEAGRANEAVFASKELAAFARPWLDDVTNCQQKPADTYGGTAMVGDLESQGATAEQLAEVWAKYVL